MSDIKNFFSNDSNKYVSKYNKLPSPLDHVNISNNSDIFVNEYITTEQNISEDEHNTDIGTIINDNKIIDFSQNEDMLTLDKNISTISQPKGANLDTQKSMNPRTIANPKTISQYHSDTSYQQQQISSNDYHTNSKKHNFSDFSVRNIRNNNSVTNEFNMNNNSVITEFNMNNNSAIRAFNFPQINLSNTDISDKELYIFKKHAWLSVDESLDHYGINSEKSENNKSNSTVSADKMKNINIDNIDEIKQQYKLVKSMSSASIPKEWSGSSNIYESNYNIERRSKHGNNIINLRADSEYLTNLSDNKYKSPNIIRNISIGKHEVDKSNIIDKPINYNNANKFIENSSANLNEIIHPMVYDEIELLDENVAINVLKNWIKSYPKINVGFKFINNNGEEIIISNKEESSYIKKLSGYVIESDNQNIKIIEPTIDVKSKTLDNIIIDRTEPTQTKSAPDPKNKPKVVSELKIMDNSELIIDNINNNEENFSDNGDNVSDYEDNASDNVSDYEDNSSNYEDNVNNNKDYDYDHNYYKVSYKSTHNKYIDNSSTFSDDIYNIVPLSGKTYSGYKAEIDDYVSDIKMPLGLG